jgi:Cytosol aminopeptidase family, catalytic domain
MAGMKTDMGGSAAVLGAFQAAVKSGSVVCVVCVLCVVGTGLRMSQALLKAFVYDFACGVGRISIAITLPPPQIITHLYIELI